MMTYIGDGQDYLFCPGLLTKYIVLVCRWNYVHLLSSLADNYSLYHTNQYEKIITTNPFPVKFPIGLQLCKRYLVSSFCRCHRKMQTLSVSSLSYKYSNAVSFRSILYVCSAVPPVIQICKRCQFKVYCSDNVGQFKVYLCMFWQCSAVPSVIQICKRCQIQVYLMFMHSSSFCHTKTQTYFLVLINFQQAYSLLLFLQFSQYFSLHVDCIHYFFQSWNFCSRIVLCIFLACGMRHLP